MRYSSKSNNRYKASAFLQNVIPAQLSIETSRESHVAGFYIIEEAVGHEEIEKISAIGIRFPYILQNRFEYMCCISRNAEQWQK